MESDAKENEMIPFLNIASRGFKKDLNSLKLVMNQLEKRTHSESAYRFSERAQMAAGWWFYDVHITPEFLQKIFQFFLPQEEYSHLEIKNLLQSR